MNLNTCKRSFCAGAPLTAVPSAVHHRYNSHVYHVELISLNLFLRKNCSRLKTATGRNFFTTSKGLTQNNSQYQPRLLQES